MSSEVWRPDVNAPNPWNEKRALACLCKFFNTKPGPSNDLLRLIPSVMAEHLVRGRAYLLRREDYIYFYNKVKMFNMIYELNAGSKAGRIQGSKAGRIQRLQRFMLSDEVKQSLDYKDTTLSDTEYWARFDASVVRYAQKYPERPIHFNELAHIILVGMKLEMAQKGGRDKSKIWSRLWARMQVLILSLTDGEISQDMMDHYVFKNVLQDEDLNKLYYDKGNKWLQRWRRDFEAGVPHDQCVLLVCVYLMDAFALTLVEKGLGDATRVP